MPMEIRVVLILPALRQKEHMRQQQLDLRVGDQLRPPWIHEGLREELLQAETRKHFP